MLEPVRAATFDGTIRLMLLLPLDAAAAKNTRKSGSISLIHPGVYERIVAGGRTTEKDDECPGYS